jgi:hypothetical protein
MSSADHTAERKARLAEALRANLQKRKAQARQRASAQRPSLTPGAENSPQSPGRPEPRG